MTKKIFMLLLFIFAMLNLGCQSPQSENAQNTTNNVEKVALNSLEYSSWGGSGNRHYKISLVDASSYKVEIFSFDESVYTSNQLQYTVTSQDSTFSFLRDLFSGARSLVLSSQTTKCDKCLTGAGVSIEVYDQKENKKYYVQSDSDLSNSLDQAIDYAFLKMTSLNGEYELISRFCEKNSTLNASYNVENESMLLLFAGNNLKITTQTGSAAATEMNFNYALTNQSVVLTTTAGSLQQYNVRKTYRGSEKELLLVYTLGGGCPVTENMVSQFTLK